MTSTGTRVYDAENRMISATDGNENTNEYSYDADGRRVRRYVANEDTETWQVYGFGGELLAEYDPDERDSEGPREYGYRNGQLLITAEPPTLGAPMPLPGAQTPGVVQWLVTDQLGTPRMVVDTSGSLAGVSRHDYLPFGEELSADVDGRTAAQGYTAADNIRQQFTSKERDNETGLDYFGARYLSSTQGRFTSADPIMMKRNRQLDPQRISLYAYVRNNPLKYVDATGEDIVLASQDANQQKVVTAALVEIAKTKSGREFLQKLEDSKVTFDPRIAIEKTEKSRTP